ncbi:unnamed protein product, partial [Closterium sp. Yama58-4]
YTLEELHAAMDHFWPNNVCGEGSYGVVYKGWLDGQAVAIKQLKNPDAKAALDEMRERVEVQKRIDHPNAVRLLGYCTEDRALVYEFLSNGSLEDRMLCVGGTTASHVARALPHRHGVWGGLHLLVYEFLSNSSLEDRMLCVGGTPPLMWRASAPHRPWSAVLRGWGMEDRAFVYEFLSMRIACSASGAPHPSCGPSAAASPWRVAAGLQHLHTRKPPSFIGTSNPPTLLLDDNFSAKLVVHFPCGSRPTAPPYPQAPHRASRRETRQHAPRRQLHCQARRCGSSSPHGGPRSRPPPVMTFEVLQMGPCSLLMPLIPLLPPPNQVAAAPLSFPFPPPWSLSPPRHHQVAAGLQHLHTRKPPSFPGRKTANVLLDDNFTAKLGDVGLARLMGDLAPGHSHVVRKSVIVGTEHYVDPEYLCARRGYLGPKSDVYSFGIVLLAAAGWGCPNPRRIDAARWKGRSWLEVLLDPRAGEWPPNLAMDLANLGLWCAEMDRRDRRI